MKKLIVLNGSPRKSGTISRLLETLISLVNDNYEIEVIRVCDLNMQFCRGCMACRQSGHCVLPEDDAHVIGEKIRQADVLIIGTPTYWGNMSGPLKVLLDRNVFILMGENKNGFPIPRQKGKKAIIVTACTTPWPFNFILAESRGAIRALKEILHYGGYKIIGKIVKPNTKKHSEINFYLKKKIERLNAKL
ncbi:MAG: flavodoxin family protein [Candidatus Marinimicrobia bacterium]|nr:flavodoxin family protein [Candidatus Neomarinimicrobiota bacterium]